MKTLGFLFRTIIVLGAITVCAVLATFFLTIFMRDNVVAAIETVKFLIGG